MFQHQAQPNSHTVQRESRARDWTRLFSYRMCTGKRCAIHRAH